MFKIFVIFDGEKHKKTIQKMQFSLENPIIIFYLQHFCNFYPQNLIFLQKKIKFGTLWSIFFVSAALQNFDVDFWPFLNAEKVLPRADFSGNYFSST